MASPILLHKILALATQKEILLTFDLLLELVDLPDELLSLSLEAVLLERLAVRLVSLLDEGGEVIKKES